MWKLYVAGAMALVIVALGFGLRIEMARSARLAAQVVTLTKDRDVWKAWFHGSESARTKETRQANDALEHAALMCDRRVAKARAAGAAIHSIVTKEVPRDPQGCAVPDLVGDDELRDLFGSG